ncbi:hypothetical protein V5799_030155 [Amblyomma americanum]|uniref:Uncharacterized protein n=1 Tax=Amblyomma americanum TaxID=6943 RepID=A0AAQ4EP81_AMBAM
MNNTATAKKWSAVHSTVRLRGQASRIKKELKEGKGSLRKWFSYTNFTVNVTFSGFIAYGMKSSAENGTEYQTVAVGNLNDTSKGILRQGENLTCTFEGVYGRYLVIRDISTFKHSLVS